MIDTEKNGRLLAAIAIAIAVVAATYIAAHAWESVRTRPHDRTIQVTGSANKRIVSDLIQWTATVTSQNQDRIAAYHALHDEMAKTRAFLAAKGIKDSDVTTWPVYVRENYETEYQGTGAARIQRRVFKGYRMSEDISVRSTDVTHVAKIARQVTDLIEQGVSITSSDPRYFYTKLGALKIEMLAEAGKDARTRAKNIIRSAGGGSLGRLRSVDMGVININPANSRATSWQGNNDTTSLKKDIITVVHATYEMK